jgi:hypothetical protein
MSGRPEAGEYAPFYAGYVARVPEGGVLEVLAEQPAELRRIAAGVPPERQDFRYAPEKWSLRQLFSHLIDAERVFGYRALCIAHGDTTPLPGFDEKAYVAAADLGSTPLAALAEELALLREGNLALFRRLPEEAWTRTGNANGQDVSVRALAWILAGHLRHHLAVLAERYGVS